MHIVSHAQNFEDVMLWRALKTFSPGFYIDIGAAWPDSDSVTKWFYENGWRGINVEPNAKLHALLEAARPRDINLAVAVGDAPGTVVFHLVDNPGLSTLEAGIASQHVAAGWAVTELKVDVVTLASICERHVAAGQAIHFLKIDVEGLETAAIRGHDWQRYRPWIVLVEATLPMTQVENHAEWEPLLLEAAYRFVYADGLNRFYVAREHEALAAHFAYPPNVFDEFKRAGHQRAEDAEIALQRASIAAEAAAKMRLESTVEKFETEISKLTERLDESKTESRALAQLNEIAEAQKLFLRQGHEKLQAEIDGMSASWSWQLTKPFRKWHRSLQKRKATLARLVSRKLDTPTPTPTAVAGSLPHTGAAFGESRLDARARKVLADLRRDDGKDAP